VNETRLRDIENDLTHFVKMVPQIDESSSKPFPFQFRIPSAPDSTRDHIHYAKVRASPAYACLGGFVFSSSNRDAAGHSVLLPVPGRQRDEARGPGQSRGPYLLCLLGRSLLS
jgi:hypothetical protein